MGFEGLGSGVCRIWGSGCRVCGYRSGRSSMSSSDVRGGFESARKYYALISLSYQITILSFLSPKIELTFLRGGTQCLSRACEAVSNLRGKFGVRGEEVLRQRSFLGIHEAALVFRKI